MIGRDEVLELAREFQLTANVVEKDYALGWMLAGIANHPALRDSWVFKGGTCLKKCYFETYRFSEDLDFTLRDPAHLDQAFLDATFAEIAEWVLETAGLELPADARRFEIYENNRGHSAGEGRLGYRGPLGRGGDPPRIKLDLASDELLALEPVRRPVHHPYSDAPAAGIHALCYAFEEVYAEKVRALAERQRPRDLYDVIHLHRRDDLTPDRAVVRATLQRKCEFKGIGVPTFATLQDRPERQAIETEWQQMLAHQLPSCPPFAQFWAELPAVFAWLAEELPAPPAAAAVRRAPMAAIAVAAPGEEVDETWRAPAMAVRWGYQAPLEVIRFAASNHLCVELGYQGSTRLIEPYSLRRSKAGNVLLYAVRADNGQVRAYRVDRIQSARVSDRPFTPRYRVEISGGGQTLAMPVISRPSTPGARIRATSPRRRAAPYVGIGALKHKFECPVCHKTFTRKEYDASLNEHKNRNGMPCFGRFGIYRGMVN